MASRKEVTTAPVEMSLIPPARFFMVIDLNNLACWGPFNTDTEAKYKAAELAAELARGPKPVGVFQYIGGVTKEAKPLFWNEATEEPRK